MNAFSSMVSLLNNVPKPEVNNNDYQIFCREYIFDQLKGKRFGKAFCERFNVNDTVVSCLFDEDIAREMIEENYIA